MGSLFKGALAAIVLTVGMAIPGAASAQNYGAIAYSPSTGAWGRSWDYRTRRTAERRAMRHCRRRARDCRVLWFRNACGAVAVGRNGGWGSAWGRTKNAAFRNARAQCRRYDGGCRVRVWQCTSR